MRAAVRFGLGALLGLLMAAGLFWMVVSRSNNQRLPAEVAGFLREVDLTPLDRAAVYSEGRIKSFDSFAQEIMGFISGSRRPQGLPPDLAYLDLMLRAERYANVPVIYVKNESMRAQLAAALQEERPILDAEDAARRVRLSSEELAAFQKTGLISRAALQDRRAQELMDRWAMDVVRTAKHVNTIRSALNLSEPSALFSLMQMIPPPDGQRSSPWLGLGELWQQLGAPGIGVEALPPETRAKIRENFNKIAVGWQAEDAPAVNAGLAGLAEALRSVAPELYPSQRKLLLESWYFKAKHLTWGWLLYLVSGVFLLMAVVYRWDTARQLGMGLFVSAFATHTVALAWRWYVSGRWPNSNMFEAVTTSVWLGALCAIGVELWARRSALRNLFALGAAGASMCGLMAAHFIPELNPSINNMMPVLHDLWLYIHTNVIIASYALIAMAAITATLYLVRRIAGGGREYAAVGGAAMLVEASSENGARRGTTLGEVFDGATMVLMELAFVMLWAGIVMGAIWADHSWGRPWGWDPKEVFALNTFLVFLILVHVRLKVRDKGLWTALLAITGAGVMIFNWVVINFVISGLHSYA